MSSEPEIDLDELAAWTAGQGRVTPEGTAREFRVGYYVAVGALQALQARGDLKRAPSRAGVLAWRLAPGLPLSPEERQALLRLLDDDLRIGPQGADAFTLRAVLERLRRMA